MENVLGKGSFAVGEYGYLMASTSVAAAVSYLRSSHPGLYLSCAMMMMVIVIQIQRHLDSKPAAVAMTMGSISPMRDARSLAIQVAI